MMNFGEKSKMANDFVLYKLELVSAVIEFQLNRRAIIYYLENWEFHFIYSAALCSVFADRLAKPKQLS